MLGRGPRRSWLSVFQAMAVAAISAAILPAHAGTKTIILLDASNSMNSAFSGVRRIDAARQSLSRAVPRYDAELDLGLVVFGNRQRQSCRDIQALVPPGAGNAAKVVAAARNVKAQGVSMLAQALERAATEASHRSQPAAIVAIVDGAGVDACLVDTCATAAALKSQSKGLVVHIVAVAPKAPEVPLLECVASATGGTYVAAVDEKQLHNAVDLALRASASGTRSEFAGGLAPVPKSKPRPPIHVADAPAPRVKPDPGSPEPELTDELGAAEGEIANTESVFAPTRPQGRETATALLAPKPAGAAAGDGKEVVMAPSQKSGETTVATVPPPKPQPAQAPEPQTPSPTKPGTTILYKRVPETASAATAPTSADAAQPAKPAADQSASETTGISNGNANSIKIVSASDAITDAQSATTPTVANAEPQGEGAIRLSALIVEGSKPVPEGMMWQVFRLTNEGARGALAKRSSDPMPTLNLPAGSYLVEGVFGNARRDMPVVIKPNEEFDAKLILDVGGLQLVPSVAGIADAGAEISNTIFAENETRTPVVANAAAGAVIYLVAGQYRIVSTYGNANAVAEDSIRIQRGKLTQAKINHRAAPVSFSLAEKAGGPPLPDAEWVITDQSGTTVKQSQEATPTYILAEGGYQITVTQAGRTFSKSITVEQGAPQNVEILAR